MNTEGVTRLLVVDDDEYMREVGGRYLRSAGYQVDTAASAEEAFEFFARGRYDCVITDINMPGADGHEVLARAKAQAPDTLVIMVTGYANLDSAIRAVRDGASDYIQKPVEDLNILALTVERTLATRRLLTKVLALEEINRQKEEFISILSHELKTPLTILETGMDLLGETFASAGGESVELVKMTHDAVRRLSRVVDDIFTYKALSSGEVTVRQETIDFGGVVDEVFLSLKDVAQSAKVSLATSEDARGEAFLADRDLFVRALGVLVENAVKFNKAGGHVTVSFERGDGRVAVRVRDDGPGIPENVRDAAFSPIKQGEFYLTRERGGVGLGLPIARVAVRAQGGDLAIESAPGSGTTVTISLPQAK